MTSIRLAGCALAFAALAWGTAPDATPSPAAPSASGPAESRVGGDRAPSPGRPPAAARSLPLFFEENRGQAPEGWDFLVRCRGYHAFVRGDGIQFSFDGAGLRLTLDGAKDVDPDVAGLAMDARANYFLGNDATRWIRGIPLSRGARYADVAPGTSWSVGGRGRALEFTFDVRGTEPSFALDGARSLGVDLEGRLVAEMPHGRATFTAPVAWQDLPAGRRDVAARFVPGDEGRVRIALGPHDASRPVHVDPTVSYASYLGKDGQDDWVAAAMDSGGSAFLAGSTESSDFPVTSGAYDTSHAGSSGTQYLDFFVLKLATSGDSIAWATFIGTSNSDECHALAIDSSGRPVLAGASFGSSYPTTSGAFRTSANGGAGVLTKLSADGSALVWSTYLTTGRALALALGPNDEPHVIDQNIAYKMSADAGTQEYATAVYHPTTMYSQYTMSVGISVDVEGNAFVGGTTSQENLQMTEGTIQTKIAGQLDGLVVKIKSNGAVAWRTLIGGSHHDQINGVGVDVQGRPYVAGFTRSTDFPVTANAWQQNRAGTGSDTRDAFVAFLSADGTKLRYSTYFGGSGGSEELLRICVHPSGVVYACGLTESADLPAVDAIQSSYGGGTDAFVLKVDGYGDVAWATWAGGSDFDIAFGLGRGPDGSVLVAGTTLSTDFPTQSAYQSAKEDQEDVFFLLVPDDLSPTADLPTIADTTLPTSTIGADYSAQVERSGGTSPFTWTHVSGALPPSTSFDASSATVSGTLVQVGTFRFRIRVEDVFEFLDEREVTLVVNAAPSFVTPVILPSWTRDRPYDQSLEMKDGTPPFAFSRISGTLPPGIALGTDGRISGTPTATSNSTFTVRATDAAGIHADRVFGLRINTLPTMVDTGPPPTTETRPYNHDLAAGGGTAPYTWSVADGTLPTEEAIDPAGRIFGSARAAGTHAFTVRVTDAAGAIAERAFSVKVHPFPEILTSELPAAAAGRPYRVPLSGTGGMPPLSWGAHLPEGLQIDPGSGTVSGLPTIGGSSEVELGYGDAAFAVARRTMVLETAGATDLTKGGSTERLVLTEDSPPRLLRHLELLAGTLLDVNVKGGVADGTSPTVTLTASDGTPVDLTAYTKANRKGVKARKVPIPATDRYFLGVAQAPGASGKMTLSIAIAPSPRTSATTTAGTDPFEVAFSAPPGAQVTVTAKPPKKSAALPRIVSLLDGDGADLLPGGKLTEKPKSATFRTIVPLVGGDYRVIASAQDGTSGDLVVTVKIKLPKTYGFALPDLVAGDSE